MSKKDYVRTRKALWSEYPFIAKGMGCRDGAPHLFLTHFCHEVNIRRKGVKLDLFENFSFDNIIDFIAENWQIILQVILALLAFLDAEMDDVD